MQQRFFIADLIACSTCFGHHYAHHQELKSIIQWLLPVVLRAVVFSSCWSGVELRVMRPVYRMLIYIFIQQIHVLNILNMLHNLRFFSLQNAVYFIVLPFLVPVLFTF